MTQEQIAALLLRRDRSMTAIAQLESMLESGQVTTNAARIDEAIERAKAGADGLADAVTLLTPP